MTPISKAPLHPVVETANVFWGQTSTAMKWFTKLVTNAYKYSDFLSNRQQNKADQKYRFESAEKQAYKVMEEQKTQGAAAVGGKKFRKRTSGGGEEGELPEGWSPNGPSLAELRAVLEPLGHLFGQFIAEKVVEMKETLTILKETIQVNLEENRPQPARNQQL